MSKRKKKRKVGNPSKRAVSPPKISKFSSRAKKSFSVVVGSGLLLFGFQTSMSYLNDGVSISYTKPLNSGYEFKASNDSPVDYIIDKFRVYPDFKQQMVFTISKDVIGTIDENGVSLPGGNETYMPAFEYKELDGVTVAAKDDKSFRVPPLSARDYYKPEALIVFIEYEIKPASKFLSVLHTSLIDLGLMVLGEKQKYLVTGDFWSPVDLKSDVSALEAACRDTEWFSKSSQCNL